MMFKHISIRWRLTILSILMLTFCCVGLTYVLNLSAFEYFEAAATFPATNITDGANAGVIGNDVLPVIPLQIATTAKQGFGAESIWYMLAFVLCGGILTYYMVEKSLRPLKKLNTQVKNISINNLSDRLVLPIENDEIRELTQSFNDMSDTLHNAFMVQNRFSASVAHELRTPLAVLQTKIDVFKKKNTCTKDEYEALISIFEKQTHRLRELIRNLLEMTTNNETGEQSSVCLKDIFEEISLDLEPVAKEKQVTIIVHCDDSCIIGNIDLLYRAFYNVIENGINYNTVYGSVVINVTQYDHSQIEIQINDTGIGIAEDAKKHIFEPFYQVAKGKQTANEGVGLGLSIVENIIKKHQGTITVLDNENGGTSFVVKFKVTGGNIQ